MYDVVIIGAGVSGCAIARELSRYELRICVVDKEEDVCMGTSKANSAIVHAGYDAKTGSLMAKLNVEGNSMMGELAKELDFPFKRNGSLVVCMQKDERFGLSELLKRGIENGVKNLCILEKEEVIKLEPNISDDIVAALYAPSAGTVCPFQMNIAMAENAYDNGVEFCFDTIVVAVNKIEEGFRLDTSQGILQTKYVVNAAGVYADIIHNMISNRKIHITPRRGDYCLLDKEAGGLVRSTVFQLPGKNGKGVLITPTIHGNTLIGPTAIDIEDREGTNTTRDGMNILLKKAKEVVKELSLSHIITSFSGLRAHEEGHDFIIEEANDSTGFITCAGIESPGLTAAPAIGRMVADIIKDGIHPAVKTNFKKTRKGIVNPNLLSSEERNALIKEKPAYGKIICRCEIITEGEILDAINRPLGAKSIDGVKRRTRAGMGRCQGGFCMPKVLDLISAQRGIDPLLVTKSGGESRILSGRNKELF